jgi:hypothetical protein
MYVHSARRRFSPKSFRSHSSVQGNPCAALAANPKNTKESGNLKTKTKALAKQCESTEQQLEQEQHKLTRLQNRASYLKKAQRKQRNKRLILKGVAVETIMPDTEYLSQEDFYLLVEQIYQLDAVQELVEKVTEKYRIIEDGD